MFYKLNKVALYAVAGASLAAIGTAASADVLVTSSSGYAAREYPRGTSLNDNAVFVLRRGDTVVVLTPQGTRRFRGPGRFRATGARQRSGNVLASASSSSVRPRTGVIRSGPGALDASDYPERGTWQVDISDSGNFCYVATQPITIWRPSMDDAQQITITRRTDNVSETVIFDEDQAAQAWPTGFTAVPGAEYWINWDNNIVATRITFTQLSVDLADPVAVGAALHENNCDDQLDALVRQAEASAQEDDAS